MATAQNGLTRKQQQVYDMLLKNAHPAEIAKKLKITRSGVYGHMRQIRRKGIALPTEQFGNGAGDAPSAANVVVGRAGVDQGVLSSLEDALASVEHRMGDIEAELRTLEQQQNELLEERSVLNGQRDRYTNAIAALT